MKFLFIAAVVTVLSTFMFITLAIAAFAEVKEFAVKQRRSGKR
jgi:hypothetical protein